MTPPVRHLKRLMASHTMCDPPEDRVFAETIDSVTCRRCIDIYGRESAQWYADLRERLDKEEDTQPGKKRRK